jgi:roadblock/LC7 domain-containing protein
MSNLFKSKQKKFVATIFTISSIVSIFISAEKAEAIPLNTTIPPGSSIKSNNQCFRLDAQNDGNLVIYKQSNGQALWNTGTYGRNVNRTIFQNDGNLVIYNTSNQAVWASRTDGRSAANLYMQDDGNLVIYNSQSQAIWASNTLSSCGNPPVIEPNRPPDSLINNTTMPLGTTIKSNNQCFSLNAQTDGNLVLYRKSNGQALWDTKTYGRNVNKTIFQNDGNLVIYNTSNQAVWASRTDGRGGKRLTVQDDGNLVIYNAQNQALWATNTMTSCTQPTQRESKKKVDAFVNKWLGKIQITRNEGANYYPG